MTQTIKVENIIKFFGKTQALNNINIEVNKGEIFGLIGPDGAGKTTLIRIIGTLLLPDSGKATVLGFDTVKEYKKIRNLIGYMPGRFSLYRDLSVQENINLFASIYGTTIEENYKNIEPIYVQLEPFKDRLADKLSGGMKQKLALCCSLVHKPQLLLLDEPTTGVDPVSRKEFWDTLGYLKEQGMTILVSTPYMDEAARCDRVALINKSKIMSIDTPANIVSSFKKPIYSVVADNKHVLSQTLKDYPFAESAYPFGEKIHYIDKRADFVSSDLFSYLMENGLKKVVVERTDPNIEDCFMDLMVKHDG